MAMSEILTSYNSLGVSILTTIGISYLFFIAILLFTKILVMLSSITIPCLLLALGIWLSILLKNLYTNYNV